MLDSPGILPKGEIITGMILTAYSIPPTRKTVEIGAESPMIPAVISPSMLPKFKKVDCRLRVAALAAEGI
jgi:hypothetical protein